MPNRPDIALCVVTYERPRSLALVLESIAAQRNVRPEQMELVVSDDGSRDETAASRGRVSSPSQISRQIYHTSAFNVSSCELPQCWRQGDAGSVFIVSRRRLHFAATPT